MRFHMEGPNDPINSNYPFQLVACITRCVFIVQYYAVFQCESAHITLMEYVTGVDLNQLIKITRRLEPETVRGLAAQLYIALEYLHLHGTFMDSVCR